jgi:hypothetical protein
MNYKYLNTAFLLAGTIASISTGANAQEQNSLKSNAIGPAVEFSNGDITVGVKAKVAIGQQFSIRPTILFGYDNDLRIVNANNITPGSGIAYGAAITYDIDSADKKFTAYIGPRALFSSGSVSQTLNGGQVASLGYNQTDIGLLVGGDYAISDNFTAGVNVVYNFARSGSATLTTPLGTQIQSGSINGNNFDFGINFAYRF